MVPYLIVFVLSITLLMAGYKIRNTIFGKILIFTGLLVPCMLAGIRDISIGTDTKGYVYNLYALAKDSNTIRSFFDIAYKWYAEKDYCYLLITYSAAKYNLSFGFLLFIYEALIMFPLYFCAKKMNLDRFGFIICFLSFFFLLYNVSFNMVRQSIAIVLATLSFVYYMKSENKKEKIIAYILLLIAFKFHSTSIITLALFWLYNFYTNEKSVGRKKSFLSIILIGITVMGLLNYKSVLLFLGKSGLYSLSLYYIKTYSIPDFSYYQAFINILLIIMVLFNKKGLDKNYKFCLLISIINFLVSSVLGYFIMYSHRIVLYLEFILVFCFIPNIRLSSKKEKAMYLLYIVLLCISWYLYIVVMNVNETIPFISSIS